MMDQLVDFGKYRGQTLAYIARVDPGYLQWMYNEGLCTIDVIHARDRGEYRTTEYQCAVLM